MRLSVAAKIAFATAEPIEAMHGSPTPAGASLGPFPPIN
jgi:hypothetical protein